MADTSVKVSFIGDAKKLKKTIDGVDDDIDKLGKSSKSFGSKFTDGFSKVLPVLAGVGAAAGIMGVAVKAAMDDAAEQQTLATTLRNVAGATNEQVVAAEKWIDVTQRATGVADSELRPALGLLTRQTGDVTEAQGLLGIAMDVSQGTGKDLNTVAAAMVKILEGNVGAASKLVPELTGIAREGAPASEVMGALAKTFAGQTTEHAATLDGTFKRLNIAFGEMKEKLGEKLLPKLVDFGNWLIDTGIPKTEEIVGKVNAWWEKQDGLREALVKAGVQLKEFIEDVATLVGWVKQAVEWLDKLQEKITGLPGGDVSGMDLLEKLPGKNPANTGLIDIIRGKAAGGPVTGGRPYIVGERGPELFVPGRSGSIVPNGRMSGGNTIVIQTGADPQAVVEAIKQYERRNGAGWRN